MSTAASDCCGSPSPVLVEIWGEYDGGLFFECATCRKRWHRFEEGHYLRARAEKYVHPTPTQEGADDRA